MISVLDHIEYLTTKHDCVIVPGLGAFISHYSYNKSGNGLVSSLKRNIAFNMSVDYNDGLLANSIVRREKVSFDTAICEIDNYVKSLRSQLKHEGEVPVGRLGFFRLDGDNPLEFFPFVSSRANNEYFGLSQLDIKPLVEINDETKEEDVKKGWILPLTRKFMQGAATIVLLIGMTLVLSTPIIEQNNQEYANLNAFTLKSNTPNEEKRELCISIPKTNKETTSTESVVTTEDTESSLKTATGNYCLVIASLATQKQAEKYIQENNLTDCEIMKSTSKYRVYIARGTFDEMCNLKTSKYSQSDAWVCHI